MSDVFFKMSDNLLKIVRLIVWWSEKTFREHWGNHKEYRYQKVAHVNLLRKWNMTTTKQKNPML